MRVLIVDDEIAARQRLAALLAELDVEVVGEAADGVAALERIRALAPDVVLLDIAMPGIGGLDVLKKIGGLPEPRPAVMMMTARGDVETVKVAMGLGAHGYIVKPFTAKALLSRVNAVLSGNRPGPVTPPRLTIKLG